MKVFVILFATAVAALGQLTPSYLFGNVCNDDGSIHIDDSASIVLLADGNVIGSSPLKKHDTRDENYRLAFNVPSGSPVYTIVIKRGDNENRLVEKTTGTFSFTPDSNSPEVLRFDLTDKVGAQATGGLPSLPSYLFGNIYYGDGSLNSDPTAIIVLLADGEKIGQSFLKQHQSRNENYRLSFRIPSGNPVYNIVIRRGEDDSGLVERTSGSFSLTPNPDSPEVLRYDLIEGGDTDADGLFDTWEQLQLAAIGINVGDPEYSLDLITPDGDYDHDGLSNQSEFLIGTFATIFTSQVNFIVNELVADDWVSISFDAVEGRLYQLEVSTDGTNFSLVDIAVDDLRASLSDTYVAKSSGRVTVTTPPVSGDGVFYRIAVR